MYLTLREVVSVIGLKRPALALECRSKLNMTVTELRLRGKIEFDERVKLPEHLKDKVISAAVKSIIENRDETRADAMAAFKVAIEDLTADKDRIYGCDISTYLRVGRRRDIIFPAHYVHFLKPVAIRDLNSLTLKPSN